MLGPARRSLEAHREPDPSQVVADPRRHPQRLGQVGARRAATTVSVGGEALGQARVAQQAPGGVAVERQLPRPRVVAAAAPEAAPRCAGSAWPPSSSRTRAARSIACESARRTRTSENGAALVVQGQEGEVQPGAARRASRPGASAARRPARGRARPRRRPRRRASARASASSLAKRRNSEPLQRAARPPSARGRRRARRRPGLAATSRKGPVPTGAPLRASCARALHREERLRQRRQQGRVRPVERDRDHVRPEPLGVAGEAALAAQVLEVGRDRRRRRSGEPSWKRTPSRSVSVQTRGSGVAHVVARTRPPGATTAGRIRTSVSHTFATIVGGDQVGGRGAASRLAGSPSVPTTSVSGVAAAASAIARSGPVTPAILVRHS